MKNKKCFVQTPNASLDYCLTEAFGWTLDELAQKKAKLEHESLLTPNDQYHSTYLLGLARIIPKRYKFYAFGSHAFMSVASLANKYPDRTMFVATRNRKNKMEIMLIKDSHIHFNGEDPSRLFVDCFWVAKGAKIPK